MHSRLERSVVGKIARQRRARRGQSPERIHQEGLTFVELLMAMTLLTVGLCAILGLIGVAMATNNRNKKDTTSVLLAQMVVEMVGNVPSNVDTVMVVTDCAGTPWRIVTAAGGASADELAYTAAYTTAGYSMRYAACGAGNQRAIYDVRWTITTIGAMKTVVAGARQSGGSERVSAVLYAAPVYIRTAVGQ